MLWNGPAQCLLNAQVPLFSWGESKFAGGSADPSENLRPCWAETWHVWVKTVSASISLHCFSSIKASWAEPVLVVWIQTLHYNTPNHPSSRPSRLGSLSATYKCLTGERSRFTALATKHETEDALENALGSSQRARDAGRSPLQSFMADEVHQRDCCWDLGHFNGCFHSSEHDTQHWAMSRSCAWKIENLRHLFFPKGCFIVKP